MWHQKPRIQPVSLGTSCPQFPNLLCPTYYAVYLTADLAHNPGDVVDVLIWSCVETNLAIICACLPILKHLFATILRYFLSEQRPKFRAPSSFWRESEENIIGSQLPVPVYPSLEKHISVNVKN